MRRRSRSAVGHLAGALACLLLSSCSGSSAGDAGADPSRALTVDADADVQRGGTLVIATNAESNGWSPVSSQWALGGHMVASTVYESLMAVGPDGTIAPQLAERVSHNADFTEWRIEVRPDVRFHDGTPCDAAAVKANLDASKAGIGGLTLRAIDRVEVDGPTTVVVTMRSPWATFPSALAGQQGYVASPASLDDGTAATRPVGTGPFRFVEWVPDRRFVVTRNDDYRVPGLPYLDGIEFQPISDPQTRKNALVTGDVDMIYTAAPDDLRALQASSDYTIVTDQNASETVAVVNSGAPPLDRLDLRRGLAQATDQQRLVDVLGPGILEPVDSPFSPAEPWYTADTHAVRYDADAARATFDSYRDDTGAPLYLRLVTTPDAPSVARAELLSQMWGESGVDAQVVTLEQGTFVTALTSGDFDVAVIANFGYADPDFNYLFWHSSMIGPPDGISPNFSRTADPQIDAALEAARLTDDVDRRAEQFRIVTQRLNDAVAYVWLFRSPDSLVAAPEVRGLWAPAQAGFGRADAKPWFARLWLEPS